MRKIGGNSFRKYARLTLIGLLLATLFFIYQASKVGFDYDFEKFYPTSDSETEFFFEFRDKFQSDNDLMLCIADFSITITPLPHNHQEVLKSSYRYPIHQLFEVNNQCFLKHVLQE